MKDEENYPKIDPMAKVHLKKDAKKIKVASGRCPRCHQKDTFVDDDNIRVDTMLAGERVVISHLKGVRCRNCNETALDPESTHLVEEIIIIILEQFTPKLFDRDGSHSLGVSCE